MKKQFALNLALFSLGIANFTANATGLVNGSFETPHLSVPWQPYVTTPGFGWTVTSGDIDLIGSNWQASDGQQSIDINGFVAGSIYQDFTFPTSGLYVIKFDLSANPDPTQPGVKPLRLDFGNTAGPLSSLGNYGLSNVGRTHANMQYIEYTTATLNVSDAATYRMQFTALIDGNCGAVLDNVRIVAVPEPNVLAICWSALAVLWGLKRKAGAQ